MSRDQADLIARLAAADPARAVQIDDAARLALWQRLAGEPRPARTPWHERIRDRVRRRVILVPVLLVAAGAALDCQPAWCAGRAPCRAQAGQVTALAGTPVASAAPFAASLAVVTPSAADPGRAAAAATTATSGAQR